MTVGVDSQPVSLVDHAERSTAVRHLHRPKTNITVPERLGRIVMGTVAFVAGITLLTSAASVVAVALEVLLVGTGLDLLMTGTSWRYPSTNACITCRSH